MKTPMQEMFHRLEQVRFATDPVSEMFKLQEVMLEKEKEEMCNFVEHCNNRHREFIDGDIPQREYEGSIDDMFEWRYVDKDTKAKMTRERNKFWKEADEMRREREKQAEQEANAKLETFNTK
jgi:hypothetical protein